MTREQKLEVVESYQQQGIEAWPSVFPSSLLARGFSMEAKSRQILPLGGISRVLTVYCNDNTGGGWVVYQSDEHGFHNPEGPYDADGIDIAIVGDSFAQGHCVRSEETVASIIRNDYENTLSFGTNGSGPLTNLATLNEFVQPIKPKIVLWFYFEGNDLLDLEREKRSVFLLQYLQADFHQGLYSIQDEVDCKLREFVKQEQRKAEEKRIRWHVDLHGVFRFLNLTMLRAQLRSLFPNSEVSGSDYPFDKKLFFRILMRAKEISRRMGSHLYFVYLPSWERFSNSIYLNPYREQILKLVNNVKVPIIDMGEVFSEHDAPLTLFPFRLRGHYTRDGYRLVATTILSSLADDGKK